MKYSAAISAGLALAGFASAAPASVRCRETEVTADMIAAIAPTSTSCATTDECRTNVQVVDPFNAAFEKYGLNAAGQKAAVLALTSLESAEYVYKHNVSPGNPGQGTSNMQSFTFNLEYAQSIPELKSQPAVTAIGNAASATAAQMNAVLDLLKDDKYNFASGPWYMTTQCPDTVTALASGTNLDAAFNTYITSCVGTTMTEKRLEYWTSAKKAFGLA
ncbi:hypothetical protein F5Y08DRAFT_344126 [Xylaria arbuscula]|nr:hypothetical protein F5Y08DRAFT_344126 [Xylaria arbuscula]